MTAFEKAHDRLVSQCKELESIAGAITNAADNDNTGEIYRLADELTNKLPTVFRAASHHDEVEIA